MLDQQLTLPSQTGVSPDQNLARRAYAPGPQAQRLRVVEREIRPAGPQSAPYSYAVAGDAAEIERDLSEFRIMLIKALVVLGLGLVVATLFQVRFGLRPLRAIRHDLSLDETKPRSGLGLSIVADLAHLYKGHLELEPSPEGGLRARLELPAA